MDYFNRTLPVVVFIILNDLHVYAIDQETTRQTQETMHKIYSAIQFVLPKVFDREEFSNPNERSEIDKNLKLLSDSAETLTQHATKADKGFAFLSQSLAKGSRAAYRRFKETQFEAAAFALKNLVENCIACHSRLPSDRDFPLAKNLFKDINLKSLPLKEKARLLFATRQFDQAAKVYESYLLDKATNISDLLALDVFADYLILMIRVKKDYVTPLTVFQKFKAIQSHIPNFVKSDLDDWVAALKDIKVRKKLKDPLADAKDLIKKGRKMTDFSIDRSDLVYLISASSALHQYIDSMPKDKNKLSEAFYLLAISESEMSRSWWLSQTENYLKTAIEIAPKSEFAPKAFALLEENTIFDYSGSSGINIPPEVQKELDSLREKISK